MTGRIELVFGIEAAFDRSDTALQENFGISKNNGPLFQSLDLNMQKFCHGVYLHVYRSQIVVNKGGRSV